MIVYCTLWHSGIKPNENFFCAEIYLSEKFSPVGMLNVAHRFHKRKEFTCMFLSQVDLMTEFPLQAWLYICVQNLSVLHT